MLKAKEQKRKFLWYVCTVDRGFEPQSGQRLIRFVSVASLLSIQH